MDKGSICRDLVTMQQCWIWQQICRQRLLHDTLVVLYATQQEESTVPPMLSEVLLFVGKANCEKFNSLIGNHF